MNDDKKNTANVENDAEEPAQMTLREQRAIKARRTRRIQVGVCVAFVVVVIAVFVGITAATGGFNSASDEVVDEAAVEQTDAEGGDDFSGEDAADKSGDDSATSGDAPAASAETHTITDYEGRSVTVPTEPQNIAVFDSFSGELAIMIGAGSRCCGMPAGVMSDTILQMIYPELTSAPVSLSGSTVNVETLAAQSCDVAIVKSTLSDEERDKLDRFKIPYVVVDYTMVDEQISAMHLVGEICGGDALSRADALAQYYENMVDFVTERASQIPDDNRISVYHSINAALLTDSEVSLGCDWIELTGCICASATSRATSGTDYSATLEQIYTWDPDVVICNVAATATEIANDSGWSGLSAVQNGRVYNIPIGATRWGQRGSVETYLAMLWLGCTVYPDIYADVDFNREIIDYYRDYLGVEVDEALLNQIISGEGIRTSGNGDGTGGAGI